MRTIDQVRGGQLKEMRTRARLSQRQVGDHFGIDKSAVSEWERGLARPTVDKLQRLDSLYGGTGQVLQLFDVGPPATEPTNTDLMVKLDEVLELVRRLGDRQRHPAVGGDGTPTEMPRPALRSRKG